MCASANKQWADIVEYLERNAELPQHEFWTLLTHGDKCAMVESAKRIGSCERFVTACWTLNCECSDASCVAATSGGGAAPLMLSSFPGQECVVVLLNGHVQMVRARSPMCAAFSPASHCFNWFSVFDSGLGRQFYGKTENVQHVFSAGSVFGQLEAFSADETIAYRNDIHEVDPGDSLRMKSGQALVIHKADAQRAIRIARYGPELISEETDPDTWTPDSLAKRYLPDALYQLLLPKLYQMPREELSQWQAGESLFEAGDRDETLYVILQGLVELAVPIQTTRTQPAAVPARPESRVPMEPTATSYPSITCTSKHGTVSVRVCVKCFNIWQSIHMCSPTFPYLVLCCAVIVTDSSSGGRWCWCHCFFDRSCRLGRTNPSRRACRSRSMFNVCHCKSPLHCARHLKAKRESNVPRGANTIATKYVSTNFL